MIHKIFEAISVRVVPGLISFATLLLLASRLEPSAFGRYSTIVALAGLVASVTFGPLTLAIVAHHAKNVAAGDGKRYESSVFTTALLAAVLLCTVGGGGAALGVLDPAQILLPAAFGMYTLILEFYRARLRYWAYGAASLGQSALFLGAIVVGVHGPADLNTAFYAFSFSYLIAALVAIVGGQGIGLSKPEWSLLSKTIRDGSGYTLALIIENGLQIGMRFVVLNVGSDHLLGVFSFCLDLSQKIVGVVMNITSFAIIPIAFQAEVRSKGPFYSILRRGAVVSVAMCLGALAVVYALYAAGITFSETMFDPVTFGFLAIAVIVNRTKKLIVDPSAIRQNTTLSIALGFSVGAPVALVLAVACQPKLGYLYGLFYLIGYVVSSAVTAMSVERRPNL